MVKSDLAGILLDVIYGILRRHGGSASPQSSQERNAVSARFERDPMSHIMAQDGSCSVAQRLQRRPRWTVLHPVHLVVVVASVALLLTALPPTGLP